MYIYTYTYARQNKKYTTVRKSPRSRYLSIHSFNRHCFVYTFLQQDTTVRKSRTSLVTCLYLHTCLCIPSKTHNSTQIPHSPCYLSIFAYLSIHSFENTQQYANPAHPLLLVYICILVYTFLQKHTTVRKSRTSLVTCQYIPSTIFSSKNLNLGFPNWSRFRARFWKENKWTPILGNRCVCMYLYHQK